MAPSGFSPLEILRVLHEEQVDFLLIGGIAVASYVTDRATADIDIMVPTGEDANRRRLEQALRRLDAELIGTQGGHGQAPEPDDPYPTLLFMTRHGKLAVLYRPDGSALYRDVLRRSKRISVMEHEVRVAGIDDLVRMKLAAGRRQDLDDVATLTNRAGRRVARRRRIHARWELSRDADATAAERLLSGRAIDGDPAAQVWRADDCLNMDAERDDLSDDHLRAWVAGLHDRLASAGLVDAAPMIETADHRCRPPQPGRRRQRVKPELIDGMDDQLRGCELDVPPRPDLS